MLMTGAEIKALISGNTEYLETTGVGPSGGTPSQVVIYYAEDGTGIYKNTTRGVLWHVKWEIKGNTLCADLKERPNPPPPGTDCVRFDKTGDTVTVIDAVSGQTRAKVVKVVAGNAERLSL